MARARELVPDGYDGVRQVAERLTVGTGLVSASEVAPAFVVDG
jgi:hypothetical protein